MSVRDRDKDFFVLAKFIESMNAGEGVGVSLRLLE